MASLSDILTAALNLVQAVNNASKTYLNVNGIKSVANIQTATVISTTSGRMCNISVLATDGTHGGTIYDTNNAADLSRPIYTIPETVGEFFVNWPISYGILVVPGAGMTVSASYS